MPKLSAGRVQSVATRLIVERERARMAFRTSSYWDIVGNFSHHAETTPFEARLAAIDGTRVASGKDFDSQGKLKSADVKHLDEASAHTLVANLKDAPFKVTKTEQKPYRRSPAAPFMTSTLQQEAGRKLRFAAARTMRAAQTLYEAGYITYMRTDSTTLSESALTSARNLIASHYGKDYLPAGPRTYKNKVKNAQEAHEAIRPAGETFRSPEEVSREVGSDEGKLYELIWMRTVASQMADAQGVRMQVRLQASSSKNEVIEFSTSGLTITFPGFLRAYVEGSDTPSQDLQERERHLPPLKENDEVKADSLTPDKHETLPPARFTEASLVQTLEELGVGRPSTYASILSTIQDRGYVWRKAAALVPSFKAFAVVALLEKYFSHLVDYTFTAKMEDDLDAIASGTKQTTPWLRLFYFGTEGKKEEGAKQQVATTGVHNDMGLRAMVSEQLSHIDAREINTVALGKDQNAKDVVVRVGRYGPYVQRGDETASIPEDLPPDELSVEKAESFLANAGGDRLLGNDSQTGLPVYLKQGRFGAYVQLGEVQNGEKPKTSSLLQTMSPATLTLEEALQLLRLPRLVGEDGGESIFAQLGRYGAYIIKGSDRRSLTQEEQVFSLTRDEALALFAQPNTPRRRAAAQPAREVGQDPVSQKMITLRKGRFGPYVTDGETNASLRTGDDPEELSLERAAELLQARRNLPPKIKAAARSKPIKKSATTKTTTKKTSTRKAPAKKNAAVKSSAKAGQGKSATKKASRKSKASAQKKSAKATQA